MPSCCHSCTNPAWEAKTLMVLGCSILRLRERTTLPGVAGRKKRVARCAGFLRRLWPLPIRKNRTAASGRTTADRKGTCGMASIMARRARAAPREVQDPETIGRIPAVLVPRVSIQIARVPTVRNRTGRTQSVLPRTVRIQTDHIPIVRTPTGHLRTVRIQIDHIQIARVPTVRNRTGRTQSVLPRTVPGRRRRDSTARQERVGERDVQVRTIGGFSLLHAGVLLIVEALGAQRSRIASL